jgi:hypothetical protein
MTMANIFCVGWGGGGLKETVMFVVAMLKERQAIDILAMTHSKKLQVLFRTSK